MDKKCFVCHRVAAPWICLDGEPLCEECAQDPQRLQEVIAHKEEYKLVGLVIATVLLGGIFFWHLLQAMPRW